MDINFKKILEYAKRAKAVYESDEKIKSAFSNVKIQNLPEIDMKSFIQFDNRKKIQWIAVRGTANKTNIKLDAWYKKKYNKKLGIKLHAGFLEAATQVYDAIKPLIKPEFEIRLAGHSLGGAVVAILMLMFSEDGLKLGKTITFGQPKICTYKGVKKNRDKDLLRVIDDKDPVPLVPPTTIFTFLDGGIYRHFGPELVLRENEGYEYITERKAESIWTTSFWLKLKNIEIDAEDHFVNHYIDSIKTNL